MFDLHIGDFFGDTARTLATLYRRFPTKSTLYVEDICGPDTPDEFGLHSPRYMACFSSILWLAEENYIRYGDTIQQEAFDEVVLTQPCFLQLSHLNDIGNSPRTVISEIESVVAQGSSTDLDRLMLKLMTEFSNR